MGPAARSQCPARLGPGRAFAVGASSQEPERLADALQLGQGPGPGLGGHDVGRNARVWLVNSVLRRTSCKKVDVRRTSWLHVCLHDGRQAGQALRAIGEPITQRESTNVLRKLLFSLAFLLLFALPLNAQAPRDYGEVERYALAAPPALEKNIASLGGLHLDGYNGVHAWVMIATKGGYILIDPGLGAASPSYERWFATPRRSFEATHRQN